MVLQHAARSCQVPYHPLIHKRSICPSRQKGIRKAVPLKNLVKTTPLQKALYKNRRNTHFTEKRGPPVPHSKNTHTHNKKPTAHVPSQEKFGFSQTKSNGLSFPSSCQTPKVHGPRPFPWAKSGFHVKVGLRSQGSPYVSPWETFGKPKNCLKTGHGPDPAESLE